MTQDNKQLNALEVNETDLTEISQKIKDGFTTGYLDREDGARIIWNFQTRIFDNN